MNIQERYESAKEIYAGLGVDVDAAVERLNHIPVSMHCWQGDDVMGFEGADSLSGGIQATGNYPGKARNPQELMADIDKALNLIPGRHRINLHASYAIFQDGEKEAAETISSINECLTESGLNLRMLLRLLIQSTVFISMYLPMQNLFNHHILNCEFFQQRIHMKIKKEAEKIWTESVNCNLKFVNGL